MAFCSKYYKKKIELSGLWSRFLEKWEKKRKMLLYLWSFFFFFFYDTPWATILKGTLIEVDHVSFSAHPREWTGLSQLMPQKTAAADVRIFIFGTQVSSVCATASSYSPAWLQWAQVMHYLHCPVYFCLLTEPEAMERKRREKCFPYLFSYNNPKCS